MNHSVLRKAAILGLAAFTLAGTISPAVNAQVALESKPPVTTGGLLCGWKPLLPATA